MKHRIEIEFTVACECFTHPLTGQASTRSRPEGCPLHSTTQHDAWFEWISAKFRDTLNRVHKESYFDLRYSSNPIKIVREVM